MANEALMQSKAIIWDFQQKLSAADDISVAEILKGYLHEDVLWHGPHPLNDIRGQAGVYINFWKPFCRSFPDFERYNDILCAGVYKGDHWVSTMGHFAATFKEDWLGIPASGKLLTIRVGEFVKMQDNKIKEMYVLVDLLDVMRQVNLWPLQESYGVEGWWPKPHSYNGLVVRAQEHTETRKTSKLVTNWLDETRHFDSTVANIDLLRHKEYFHPNVQHYISSGFGASRGIDGLKDSFQNPLFTGLSQRKLNNHHTQFADGLFMGACGWECIKGIHSGELLGVEATDKPVKIRMMEWWRRSGDVIRESWIMLDTVDLLMQLGIDEFAKMHDIQEKDQWL
ncbi:MAG: SnoaL-like domain-containing protein [Gammaproteobacteria bacterium]|nr:ester cyclase [Gammaproteobacteria bacterium]NNC97429.1 SnoaL-like domain-containing protein [Gammaproteobacteria bacterium]